MEDDYIIYFMKLLFCSLITTVENVMDFCLLLNPEVWPSNAWKSPCVESEQKFVKGNYLIKYVSPIN